MKRSTSIPLKSQTKKGSQVTAGSGNTLTYRTRSSANIASKLSFSFMNDMIKDGSKKDFLLAQYPQIENEDAANPLGDKLLSCWRREKQKNPAGKSILIKSLFQVYGRSFVLTGIPFFAESLIKIGEAYVFGILLDWFQANQGNLSQGLCIGAGLSGLVLVHAAVNQVKFFLAARIGMQARIAVTSAVFTKALCLESNLYSSGQITSIITSDVQRIEDASAFVHYLWVGPLETILVTYFLYVELGAAAFAAVLALLLLIPVQTFFSTRFSAIRKVTNKFRDERIKSLSDMISGILVVKLYAWEDSFISKIMGLRSLEVKSVKNATVLRAVNEALFFSSASLISIFAFGTFFLLGGTLKPSIVFAATTYLAIVRQTMTNLFSKGYQLSSECAISLERLERLFSAPELRELQVKSKHDGDQDILCCMDDASFTWNSSQQAKSAKLEPSEICLRNVSFVLRKGELIGVCGPVGSGKSSLIHAILGELFCVSGSVGLYSKSIAYASQNPWIIGSTWRDNITFGNPYKEEWFKEVVKACALDVDFANLPDGEKTVIEEKGSNLSGGQRARLSLARAVYSDAEIFLLDDPLAAVDPKVAKHLFQYCISTVLQKKAVLLVSHLIPYIQQCDKVVLMEQGKVSAFGSFLAISKSSNSRFAGSLRNMANSLPDLKVISEEKEMESQELLQIQQSRLSLAKRRSVKEDPNVSAQVPFGPAEPMIHGSITWKSYWTYFKVGSSVPKLMMLFSIVIFGQLLAVGSDWWLAYWSDRPDAEQRQALYPALFVGLATLAIVVSLARAILFFLSLLLSSQNLFRDMLTKIFHAPLSFFQQNPQGRIMNRFSKDVNSVDEALPQTFFDLVQRSFMVLGTIAVSSIVIPYVLLLVPILVFAFLYFRKSYIASSRQMKRMEGITRSPLYSAFSVAMEGKSVIRAYRQQERFYTRFCQAQNDNTRVYFSFTCAGRWLGLRLDIIAAVYFAVIVFATIAGKDYLNLSAASLGLMISYSLQLVGLLQWTIRQSAEVENLMVSTERILDYSTNVPQEREYGDTVQGVWPSAGSIELDNLSLKYPTSEGFTLKHIFARIPAGSKCAVVGRTGAGKSSFINALFRLSEPLVPGSIRIDGLSTSSLKLHDLRSRLSIIPQEPFCFKGTLRFNLDPSGNSDDQQLWQVLETVGLKELILESPEGLESEVDENGGRPS
ncbi:Multidrug resistance-associated protein 4 [Kappamyces sp. JEL0829]|nr:Multidrug resistance-associated protein 4 [Kappamyces sp. JEL0829]